jgi:putative membrane protein
MRLLAFLAESRTGGENMKINRSVLLGATMAGLASMTAWGMDTSASGSNPPGAAAQSPSPASMASPAQTPGGAITATSSPTSATSLTHDEVQFLNDSIKRNLNEIALGFIAIEKGASDDIKEYGRQIIDSHVKDTKDLMELASRKQIFIPLDQIKLPDKDLKSLAQQPGAAFDKAFVRLVVNDQNASQAGLQQFLSQVQDKDVRNLANQMLSNLTDHLSDARDLGGELGIAQEELNPPPPVGEPPIPQPNERNWSSPQPPNHPMNLPPPRPNQMTTPAPHEFRSGPEGSPST